jgi:hypothetical protein
MSLTRYQIGASSPIVPSLMCGHRISWESGRVRQRRRADWGDAYHLYETLACSGRSLLRFIFAAVQPVLGVRGALGGGFF